MMQKRFYKSVLFLIMLVLFSMQASAAYSTSHYIKLDDIKDATSTILTGSKTVNVSLWDAVTGGTELQNQVRSITFNSGDAVFNYNNSLAAVSFANPVFVQVDVNGEKLARFEWGAALPDVLRNDTGNWALKNFSLGSDSNIITGNARGISFSTRGGFEYNQSSDFVFKGNSTTTTNMWLLSTADMSGTTPNYRSNLNFYVNNTGTERNRPLTISTHSPTDDGTTQPHHVSFYSNLLNSTFGGTKALQWMWGESADGRLDLVNLNTIRLAGNWTGYYENETPRYPAIEAEGNLDIIVDYGDANLNDRMSVYYNSLDTTPMWTVKSTITNQSGIGVFPSGVQVGSGNDGSNAGSHEIEIIASGGVSGNSYIAFQDARGMIGYDNGPLYFLAGTNKPAVIKVNSTTAGASTGVTAFYASGVEANIGNVYIGPNPDTTPNQKLVVIGNANITGTLIPNNVTIPKLGNGTVRYLCIDATGIVYASNVACV